MKTVRLVVLAMVLSVVGFSLAFAEDQQTALVVDQANVFKEKISEVTKAAEGLRAKGADVHVWAIKSYSDEAKSLELYEKKLEKSFPAWQAANGKRKNNLIVLIVSMKERKSALFYGGEWTGALGKNWVRIQTDLMSPKFKRGEFAEGFIAGLGEVTRLIDAYTHPTQAIPAQTVIVQQQAPAKVTDLTGLWTVMKWGLGLIAVFAFGFFGFQAMVKRREENEQKQRAQQKAKIEKGNAVEKITSIREAVKNLELMISALLAAMDESTAQAIKAKLQTVKDAQGKLASDFTGTGGVAGDPDADNLSEAQYLAIEEKFKEVTSSSAKILKDITALESEVNGFRDLAMNAPKTWKTLNLRVTEVDNVLAAMVAKGYIVDPIAKTIFTLVNGLIQDAKTYLDRKQYEKFNTAVQQAMSEVDDIEEQALGIAELKEGIEKGLADLELKIPAVVRMIAETKEVFLAVSKAYVSRSWESIKGNGSEAENRVKKVTAALETIRKCSSMEVQDWPQATALVENAGKWLNEAESLMRSVVSLKENLELAKVNAAKEVVDAESDIRKAHDYINSDGAKVAAGLKDDLRKAEDMIKQVKAELQKPIPDYTTAYKNAQEANSLADKVYDQAVGEREAADRLHRKAESQRNNTLRKIEKAREYVEDHDSDVGANAKSYLASAETELQQAEANGDLNQRLTLLLKSEETADNAYNLAKDDVNEAQRSRQRSDWGSRRNYVSHDTTVIVAGGYERSHDTTVVLVDNDDHHHYNQTARGSSWSTDDDDNTKKGGGGEVSFDNDSQDNGGGGEVSFDTDTDSVSGSDSDASSDSTEW